LPFDHFWFSSVLKGRTMGLFHSLPWASIWPRPLVTAVCYSNISIWVQQYLRKWKIDYNTRFPQCEKDTLKWSKSSIDIKIITVHTLFSTSIYWTSSTCKGLCSREHKIPSRGCRLRLSHQ
jgi:hypothetical protein